MPKEKDLTPEELAHQKLDALLGIRGALRLVTSRVRADKAGADLRDPETFEWEEVEKIEPHEFKDNRYRATTFAGSTVDGSAEALLHKLTDWERRPQFVTVIPPNAEA